MIAPEVVLVERLEVFADRNDAGAGGVESNGGNFSAIDAGGLKHIARGGDEGGHLVGVGLGGVIGIFATAMQRIGGRGGSDGALLLSTRVTRTLSVPKSTPATIAMELAPQVNAC